MAVDAEFQSIDRLAKMLDALAAANKGGLPLGEVARRSGLSRSVAGRLIGGLVEQRAADLGFGAPGGYYLGMRFASLVPAAAARLDLRRLLAQAMRRIAEETEDSVWLSVRVGLQSMCVASIPSPLPIKTLALKVGERRPLGVGGGALALLAFLPDSKIDEVRERGLPQRSAYGFNDTPLSGLIDSARARGYVFVEAAVVPGMNAVGVPIRAADGFPFAALSVSAISERLPFERAARVADLIAGEVHRFEAEYRELLTPIGITAIQRHLAEVFQLS